MTKDEALKLALEALQVATTPLTKDRQEILRAITAIKEALAQPGQEPVVGCAECGANGNFALYCVTCAEKFVGGYKDISWVGLTKTQVKLLWEGVEEEAIKSGDSLNWVFYTHINEALKEKNTREEE